MCQAAASPSERGGRGGGGRWPRGSAAGTGAARRGAAIRLTPAQAPSPPGTAAGSNAVRGPGPPQGGAAEQRPWGTRFH